MKNLKFSK